MFNVTIEHGGWKEMEHPAMRVRLMVFVAEQKVPKDEEEDEWDEKCEHFVARDGQGMVVGCARLLPDGHVGRLAVLRPYRGRGVGGKLLEAVTEYAREQGFQTIAMHAQTHAQPFYEKRGWVAEGDVFFECGIEHIVMTKAL